MRYVYSFIGEYRFLSNFFKAMMEYNGLVFYTSEAAYQAQKTMDRKERINLSKIANPSEAKRIGGLVTLREDWTEENRIWTMEDVVTEKFKQHGDLLKLLKRIDGPIEEGNSWGDTFWGISPPGSGLGRNELGKILMRIRDKL